MEHSNHKTELATFAGGCFWCMVRPFDELPGILSLVSGYTGGHTDNPTYEEVGTETTGHAEAVQITFESEVFPYERLLEIYWQLIDPTDKGGQFMDRGASYRTAIFVHNEQQHEQAEASKRALQASGRFKGKIVTEIMSAGKFYPAEAVHQNYYKTHRFHYNLYQEGSGRTSFAERYWNTKKDKQTLQKRLTRLQFEVTQNGVDEPAFDNEYWNNTREGIYVDRVNSDPLFCSRDQFDAGTGLPAFTKPIHEGLISKRADLSNGKIRTALRGRLSGSYLGHVFHNGPQPGGLHYQVNSAALRFVPKEELKQEGYGKYVALFDEG
ncbi:peptide-methionine (R)-S-oxide reductase [Paenibacillus sp. J23TS9]|uniref:peptide-methionine (S)-S-oxide reductase MsrA n=1 Tax=Paenibacillus sp. J23TS9 TaxID=2807193 RepID=UPI001B163337|nr:peptide-methionine (S)-S-oxide reductase MsrA [Paenibacillus sp. J23TS9]GIP30193.1 peptide-methionine (R)-S-oxide reductase [Paenibacillus sp. J23TS9]